MLDDFSADDGNLIYTLQVGNALLVHYSHVKHCRGTALPPAATGFEFSCSSYLTDFIDT